MSRSATALLAGLLAALLTGLLALAAAQPPATAAPGAPSGSPESTPGWTVQVIALRDLRDATAVVDDLRGLGFDAYAEFTMADGQQWVRVRVGCFEGRDAAAGLAALLRGAVVETAVPVERSPGAPAGACVRRTVGFLKPAEWREIGPGVYRVVVAGRSATVAHDGVAWRVGQQSDGDPLAPRLRAAGFRTESRGGRPVVAAPARGVLCPGRLLADLGTVAVVEESAAVVACAFVDQGAGGNVGGNAGTP